MPAMEPLRHAFRINTKNLSREENLILEAELFIYICKEIQNYIKAQYKEYFRLLKYNPEMENTMIESNFIRCLINDIINTEAYTLSGIALYTQTPEEIIYDLASGFNSNPTLTTSQRIIELHRSVRPTLYENIRKKTLEI